MLTAEITIILYSIVGIYLGYLTYQELLEDSSTWIQRLGVLSIIIPFWGIVIPVAFCAAWYETNFIMPTGGGTFIRTILDKIDGGF